VHAGSKAAAVKGLTEARGAKGRAHSGDPYQLLRRVVEGRSRAVDAVDQSAAVEFGGEVTGVWMK
jgi:hypothetical protein